MASINGISIKNLKSFVGHEGTCYQGDIYYNGKKLGFWSQDGDGAICDDFDFDENILKSEVKKYIESDMVAPEYKAVASLESLLNDLIDIILDEKTYKKALKNGYDTTVSVSDGFHCSTLYINSKHPKYAGQKIEDIKDVKNFIEDCKPKFFKSEMTVNIYRSLDDFKVTV